MKKINWLDHFTNLLVVILGITIAFYLEGYKEDSNNRAQEKKYLESLVSDLEVDIQALDTLLKFNDNISEALINLSNASLGQSYGGDSTLVNHTFVIQYNPPFTSQRTTYESMKASGRLDLIADFEIRNQIVELYEQYYRGTNEYDAVLDEHIRDFIKPYYMENIRFVGQYSLDPSFLKVDKYRNMIFAYRYLFFAKNDFYQQVKDQTDSVKVEVESYLNQL